MALLTVSRLRVSLAVSDCLFVTATAFLMSLLFVMGQERHQVKYQLAVVIVAVNMMLSLM